MTRPQDLIQHFTSVPVRCSMGKVRSYAQYCPIARTSEILAERWTPLVIRNLMFGADTFSSISRGVPSMSRSMLVTRLKELELAGIVTREPKPTGAGSRYLLTEAGHDLAGVLETMAGWGERWVEIGPEQTDPGFTLWAWCTAQLNRDALPVERVLVEFTFVDQPAGNRTYWLLVENREAQVCYTDPGGEPAVYVRAQTRAFLDWHRGQLPWARALRTSGISVSGDPALVADLPTWNALEPHWAGPTTRTEPVV
jgi:DNA-binding HxlR family transcriptional regulator